MAQGRMERRYSFVAVERTVGDWAAYQADDHTGFYHTDEEIAAHGDKLPYSVAAAVFPRWDEELTWRR